MPRQPMCSCTSWGLSRHSGGCALHHDEAGLLATVAVNLAGDPVEKVRHVLADAVALGQAKNVKVSDFEAPAEGEGEAAADGETPAAETTATEAPAAEAPAAETPAAEAAPAAEEQPAQEPEPAAVAAAGDDQTSSEDKTSE